MPGVLGFSGRKRSGKTTISKAVAGALGWRYASFGDYVRSEAERRQLPANSVQVLQDLGESLIRDGWPAFCENVIARSKWSPGEGLIVDGIRHVEAMQQLKLLTTPSPFALVYVSADDALISDRLRTESHAELREVEKHSTETQVISALPQLANLTVESVDSVQVVVDQVVAFAKKLG